MGEYQVIPTDERCADPYSTDPDCNLKVAIGGWYWNGIQCTYIEKWLYFIKH